MLIRLLLLILITTLIFTGLNAQSSTTASRKTDIGCDSIPKLNDEIVAFARSNLKKKVGTGQCWDLAAAALRNAGASWDGRYAFGREVDYRTECIYPGDIIQFEKVVVEYEKDGAKWREDMMHHTAIIYEVKSKGNFTLAHQNIGTQGKKVGLTSLDLANITKGKFKIFRPVKT